MAEPQPVVVWTRGGPPLDSARRIGLGSTPQKGPLMNLLTVVVMRQQVVKFVGAEFRKSET